MILTKEAIESISQKLSLTVTGGEQDWEVEVADSERVGEFVSFYQGAVLSLEEKKALMSLIFASYDDYLNKHETDGNLLWSEIVLLVQSDKNLFTALISYWSLEGEASSDCFQITPLVRRL